MAVLLMTMFPSPFTSWLQSQCMQCTVCQQSLVLIGQSLFLLHAATFKISLWIYQWASVENGGSTFAKVMMKNQVCCVFLRHSLCTLCICRFQRALPIYNRCTDILDAIDGNPVCVLLRETGSGKSTQLMQYAHAAGYTQRGTVICTQPRKVFNSYQYSAVFILS